MGGQCTQGSDCRDHPGRYQLLWKPGVASSGWDQVLTCATVIGLVVRPFLGACGRDDNGAMTAPPGSADHSANNGTDSTTRRRPWDIPPGWAAVGVAVIGVLGGLVGRATATNTTPTPVPGPTVTTTITASPTLTHARLEFSLTAGSRVPWCQTYTGTGTIPPGYVLAIFDTPAGPQHFYSFDQMATQLPGSHWRTMDPLQIGTRGQAGFHVDIVGVLTSRPILRYMASIRALHGAPWISEALPPGPEISLPVITNGRTGLTCR